MTGSSSLPFTIIARSVPPGAGRFSKNETRCSLLSASEARYQPYFGSTAASAASATGAAPDPGLSTGLGGGFCLSLDLQADIATAAAITKASRTVHEGSVALAMTGPRCCCMYRPCADRAWRSIRWCRVHRPRERQIRSLGIRDVQADWNDREAEHYGEAISDRVLPDE